MKRKPMIRASGEPARRATDKLIDARALSGDEIKALMRNVAPAAAELDQRMKRNERAGWQRLRGRVLH